MRPRLLLNKEREQRQLRGHPWVYDSDIARVVGTPHDGDVVDCYSHGNKFLGRGYFNSRSKIRLRVLTRHIAEDVNDALLKRRLSAALARRHRLYPEATSLRLVHAEGDGLPGLTIDRYEDVLVMQCTSLGMDRQRDTLAKLLRELTGIDRLYLRNDLGARRQDGLELASTFYADPFATTVSMQEHGLTFEVDVAQGHKTGFYLDQADNHLAMRAFVPAGGTVLDAFCYTGAFAVHAAAAGASQVLGLETSAKVLGQAQQNAALNQFSEQCHFETVNVFVHLRQLRRQGQRFDVIVLDPPSFTRHRDAVAKALDGYKEIHLQALKLLRPGGILLTFSCSHYIDRTQFETTVLAAAHDAERHLIMRQRFSQSAHHPEVMAIPETSYVKGLAVEVW